MLATQCLELLDQPTALGDHDRPVTGAHQCRGNLERAALHPAAVEGGQHLHHGQASRCGLVD